MEASCVHPSEACVATQAQLRRYIRKRIESHLVIDSVAGHGAVAIYSLSDPRDLRTVRYIGQTCTPRRRLLQHLNCARLWLPDELPWWVKSPRLRPLYGWIRALFRDDGRLPVMWVTAWAANVDEARVVERSRIYECGAQCMPLLNSEMDELKPQRPLL